MPEHADVFLGPLRAGAARSNRSAADLDLVIPVAVEITEEVDEAVRRHARGYAFTIGAMGSRDQNFYNAALDRKSTRLNSSHQIISYAVFCLKKKTPQSRR